MAKKKRESDGESKAVTKGHSIRCRFCGQKNAVKADYKNRDANCGKCKLPLSDEPHKKFADLSKHDYIHPADSKALAALKAIPGVDSALKKFLGLDRRISHTRHVHGERGKGHAEAMSRPSRQIADRLHDARRRYAGSVHPAKSDRECVHRRRRKTDHRAPFGVDRTAKRRRNAGRNCPRGWAHSLPNTCFT